MFEEADIDGDGEIYWTEFLEMTKKRMKAGQARINDLYSKVMNSHHSYSES